MTTIVFAAAVALGFLTPVADARPMKECSGRYHAPAKASARTQCGPNASKVFSRRPPRGITLGIGDIVSITITPTFGRLSCATGAPNSLSMLRNAS